MKTGDLVMTNVYGPNEESMVGIIIHLNDHLYDVLWSNGEFEQYINSVWLKKMTCIQEI